ncbi:hypothetical protein IWZ00DRAFT_513973 [Phyllosticta capitalensis]|uniref:uncharacterized protein n=1 Tax=Phyllosticta capitalensis TaxID=121624 RepID=UPI00312E9215
MRLRFCISKGERPTREQPCHGGGDGGEQTPASSAVETVRLVGLLHSCRPVSTVSIVAYWSMTDGVRPVKGALPAHEDRCCRRWHPDSFYRCVERMRREGLLHSDAKSARAMKSWPIFPNFHAFCFFSFLSALGKWSSGMGPAVGTLFFSSTPSIDFFPSHCTSCTYGVLFFCTLPLLNPSTAVGSRARIVAVFPPGTFVQHQPAHSRPTVRRSASFSGYRPDVRTGLHAVVGFCLSRCQR